MIPPHRVLLWIVPAAVLPIAVAAQSTSTAAVEQQLRDQGAALWEQANALRAEGKLVEAVAAAEKLLAIERRLLGDIHEEVATILGWTAVVLQDAQDFAGAERQFRELQRVLTAIFGAADWRTTDARLAADNARRLQTMAPGARRQVADALTKSIELVKLFGRPELRKAAPIAEEIVRVRTSLLGADHPDTLIALSNLGLLYREIGDHVRAEPALLQTLERRRRVLGARHPATAFAMEQLSGLYNERGDTSKAEPLLVEALAVRRQVSSEAQVANALNDLGVLYGDRRELGRAETMLLEALNIRRRVLGNAHPETAMTVSNLGAVYRERGDFKQAEPLLTEALQIRRTALGDGHRATAESLLNLALLAEALGQHDRAEDLYRQALTVQRTAWGNDHPQTATTADNLGNLYRVRGNLASAGPLMLEALAIRRRALGPDHEQTAISLNNVGQFYADGGDYAKAQALFEEALATIQRLGGQDHPTAARVLNNLALVHAERGDFTRAASLHQQALTIRRRALGDAHQDTVQSLNNLAVLYSAHGDYARAEGLHEQALAATRAALGDRHPMTAMALSNIGSFYVARGDYVRAKPPLEDAVRILRAAFGDAHIETATALNSLGHLYQASGDLVNAEQMHRQALAATIKAVGPEHPNIVKHRQSLGVVLLMRRELLAAKTILKTTVPLAHRVLGDDHPDVATLRTSLGSVHDMLGDARGAEPHFKAAVRISRRNLQLASLGQSDRQQLAMTVAMRWQLDMYLSLVARTPGLAKAGWQEVLAWKGMIQARQRAARSVIEQPELQSTFDELQRTTSTLAALVYATDEADRGDTWRAEVERLSTRKEELERDLSARSALFRQAMDAPDVDRVVAALPAGAALIDFLQYEHLLRFTTESAGVETRLLAFVIRPHQKIQILALGAMAPISAAIDEWRRNVATGGRSTDAEQFLRQRLWDPIEAVLSRGATSHVLISPDASLGLLAWGALPGRAPGQYLIEDWPVSVVPVPQLLPEMLKPPAGRAATSLLAVGAVNYDRGSAKPSAVQVTGSARSAPRDQGSFAPLPGTRDELAAIADRYRRANGADGFQTLAAADATESAFRRDVPRHTYLHLATHGFFAAERFQSALERAEGSAAARMPPTSGQSIAGYHPGLLSGLALAGANAPTDVDDGILTAEEVATLNLSATTLAVLSACETGLGQVAGGEGLLGLQRAFHTAGARTVIASLWKVNDLATRDLMIRFYDNLWTRKLGKLEALREAQLWMLRQNRERDQQTRGLDLKDPKSKTATSPVHAWAGFVLSGDWR